MSAFRPREPGENRVAYTRASMAYSLRHPAKMLILCTEANYERRKAMVDAGLFDDAYFPRSPNHES